MPARIIILIAFLSAFGSGCSTPRAVKSAALATGATRVYIADFDDVMDAVRSSLESLDLRETSEEPTDGGVIAMAQRGITGWSWGEIVRVLVKRHGTRTTVRVISEKVYAPNVTAKDFTEDLFTRIGQRLGDFP
jgi:hypothetical protein